MTRSRSRLFSLAFSFLVLQVGRASAAEIAAVETPAASAASTPTETDDATIYNMPAGSIVTEPDGTHFVTSATLWLLTRGELDGVILQSDANKRLEAALADCQKRADGTPPKPSFWQSTRGHRIEGVATGVVIAGAAYGGYRVGIMVRR